MRVRVRVTGDSFELRLAGWQKALGLMRNITLPLSDLRDARVVEDPIRETLGTGLKVGLRLPGLYYVARTIRLDRVFVVRRGVPALSVDVRNHTPLQHVLVSTPEAVELARRIGGSGAAA